MNYYWADLFNPRFLWPPRIIHYRKGRKERREEIISGGIYFIRRRE
jgi:hypothetical protein